MTTLIGCPEPVLLSQLLDRELAQEEENVLRRHVETCIECNARLDQLAKAKNMAQSGLRHALQSPFVTPSLECFSPERVSANVQRQLSAGEHEAAERHLRTCQKCLGEVMEAFRITKNLTRKRHVPVPAALKARVASQWKQTPAPAAKEATVLSRFVLHRPKGFRAGGPVRGCSTTGCTDHACSPACVSRRGRFSPIATDSSCRAGNNCYYRCAGRNRFISEYDHYGPRRDTICRSACLPPARGKVHFFRPYGS